MGSSNIRGRNVGAAFSCEIDFFDIKAVGTGFKLNGTVKNIFIASAEGENHSPDPKTFLSEIPIGVGVELSPFVTFPSGPVRWAFIQCDFSPDHNKVALFLMKLTLWMYSHHGLWTA